MVKEKRIKMTTIMIIAEIGQVKIGIVKLMIREYRKKREYGKRKKLKYV